MPSRRIICSSSLEMLEPRVAPASLVNASTIAYTDTDGDLVTIKVSKPIFSSQAVADSAVRFNTGAVDGDAAIHQQLQLIDLSLLPTSHMTLSVTAKRGPDGGDGFVNVGAIIVATDLGHVTIKGDLAAITCGDSTLSTPGLKSLTVQSMGAFDTLTQNPATPTLLSEITGGLGAFTAKSDVRAVDFGVSGDLAKLTIGGSLIGGDVPGGGAFQVGGQIGSIRIAGDLHGGEAASSGRIEVGGGIALLMINGSLRGGGGDASGRVFAAGDFGTVKLKGGISGGAGIDSGALLCTGAAQSIAVGGSLAGNSGPGSGRISIGTDAGTIKITGDITGGTADEAGAIDAGNSIKSIIVGGSVLGGPASATGLVFAADTITSVKVTGDLVGGDAVADGDSVSGTGAIRAGRLLSVTIGGSIISGSVVGAGATLAGSGAIFADFDLGRILVKGSLLGSVDLPVNISATGQASVPANAKTNVAIGSVIVLGSVDRAVIDAGFGLNADAQIGAVTIGGDCMRSSIAAGADPVNELFGGPDDKAINGLDTLGMTSRIGSILIKGQALGSPGGGGEFGFVAQQIGSVKIGGTVFPRTANQDPAVPVGVTGDLTLREIG